MKKYFVLMCCLLLSLVVFTGCTKYEPTALDEKINNTKNENAVLEKPEGFEAWPKERQMLFEITQATKIPFSETLPQKMEWRFEQNKVSKLLTIDGYMMVAEATEKNSELVNKYLEGQGFAFDNFNVADGPMGGQVGYQKENTVCLVHSSYAYSKKVQNNYNLSDITVKCAEFKSLD